jgi:surface antigen
MGRSSVSAQRWRILAVTRFPPRASRIVVAVSVLAAILFALESPAARADTGGYTFAKATCQAAGQADGFCPGDNWLYQGKLNDQWGYGFRNCTSWVAWRLATHNGYQMPRAIGNASAWGKYFAAHGDVPNATPAVGAIAWEPHGNHVAYVEAVNGGNITISEYNEHYAPNQPTDGSGTYDTRPVSASTFLYIHVHDVSSSSTGSGSSGAQPGPASSPPLLSAGSNCPISRAQAQRLFGDRITFGPAYATVGKPEPDDNGCQISSRDAMLSVTWTAPKNATDLAKLLAEYRQGAESESKQVGGKVKIIGMPSWGSGAYHTMYATPLRTIEDADFAYQRRFVEVNLDEAGLKPTLTANSVAEIVSDFLGK